MVVEDFLFQVNIRLGFFVVMSGTVLGLYHCNKLQSKTFQILSRKCLLVCHNLLVMNVAAKQ